MAQAKTKKVKVTAGGEKHVVYKKTTKKGEGKVGHIMVNHPTKDKGQWDTIDLTAKGKAKTVAQGVAATPCLTVFAFAFAVRFIVSH